MMTASTVVPTQTSASIVQTFMSDEEVTKIAEHLLGSCGNGTILHIGSADLALAQYFLSRGVQFTNIGMDALQATYCAQRIADRFLQWDGEKLPFSDNQFSTVLVTATPEKNIVSTGLAEEIVRISSANVFLYLEHTKPSQTSAFRKYCEAQFFQVGARKHPAYYRVNDYQALQDEQGTIAIPLEKIPAQAALKYPLTALVEERDLHMDMTREPGSRSDAHIIRYMLASRYVRPGDRVLDAACGLGYGSHILHKCSDASSVLGIDGSEYAFEYARLNFAEHTPGLSFKEGWLPDALFDIPDNSIDLITSFETLEHVQNPKALMAEFHRVLTPAGRIVLSVPRDWSDETGEDPNPFHLHVYTWNKILEETQTHFLVEAAFGQTADQFKKNKQWTVGTRQLVQINVENLAVDDPECEWCLLVAMKTPIDGAQVDYEETTYDQYPENPSWHVTNFEDYDNPWLVKGMVTIGHRVTNAELLRSLSAQVALESRVNTPDQGAGLCVMGYQLYGNNDASWQEIELFEKQCHSYLNSAISTPQQLRWQVSLCYLIAQLWQKWGDCDKAVSFYSACTLFNCAEYSPTLITKQIHAYLNLGLIESGRSNMEAAATHWRQAIESAENALRLDWKTAYGSLDNPSDFGLHELGAIVECAASCAYALKYMENSKQKTPQWWHQLHRDRVSQLRQLEAMRNEIHRLNKLLIGKDMIIGDVAEAAKREVNAIYSHTAEKDLVLNQSGLELGRLNLLIDSKDNLLNETGKELNRLNQVVVEKDLRLNEVSQEISRFTSESYQKDAQLNELGLEANRLNLLILDKDSRLNEVSQEISRLASQNHQKDSQLNELGHEANRLNVMIVEKDSRLNEIGQEISRLIVQNHQKDSQLNELGLETNRLNLMILEKDSRLNEIGQETSRLIAQNHQKDSQLNELGLETNRLNLMIIEKDSRLNEVGQEISRLSAQSDQKDSQLNELGLEINRLNLMVVERDSQFNEVSQEISRLGSQNEQNKSQLKQLEYEVDHLNEMINEKDSTIAELKDQIDRAVTQFSEERQDWSQAIAKEQNRFNQLRQTRLLRWRDALAARPTSIRSIAKVFYLSGSLVMPAPLRNRLRGVVLPVVQRLRAKPVAKLPATTPESGYMVKQPKKPASDRPVVVHVIANFMTGGSSRLVVDIYEYLGNKYDQRVLTSFAPQPAAYVGIPIEEIRFPDDEVPFVKLFEKLRPEFIHMHYWGDCDEPWYAKSILAAETLGIPVIQNINTPVTPYYSNAIKRYVYVSNYVRRVFGKDQDRHVTVYPGSDFAMFESRKKPKPQAECIGMVYRLENDKLNAESIMPFILAAQKKPSIKVLIVGGGSLMAPFMKATEDAGVAANFEFTGYVPYDSLPSIYERMSIFVAPVWKESFGQVSPFAMNMRVPVVGFDIGAIGEIVDDESLLAPPGNSDALSDIIVSLLEDTPRRLKVAENHRKRAQNYFSIQAMIKGYQNIYSDIMVEKKK